MAREKRARSSTGIYHLVIQSAHPVRLFEKDESKELYLSLIKRAVLETSSCLVCYVIMDTFAHLIIEEGERSISDVVRRANSVFCKQMRKQLKTEEGTKLLRDRFYSEPVESEGKLVCLVKQIHDIPVLYRVVTDPAKYQWSSYRMYVGMETVEPPCSVRKVQEALHFSGGMKQFSETSHARIPMLREKTKAYGLTDAQATALFEKYLDGQPIASLHKMSEDEKRETIRRVKRAEGISILQLSRITGVSRGIIQHLK